jgi:hypothetical protein
LLLRIYRRHTVQRRALTGLLVLFLRAMWFRQLEGDADEGLSAA